jgi:hypothetical protein
VSVSTGGKSTARPITDGLARNEALTARDYLGAKQIVTRACADRIVIEDFCPLADSIEWQLGQRYWQERGNKAFLSEPVPHVINNDGMLSRNVAELVFISLVEAEQAASRLADRMALVRLTLSFLLCWAGSHRHQPAPKNMGGLWSVGPASPTAASPQPKR